ncbi:MAG: hypothetical protein K2H70_04735, partial [Bacteroidales bacterium]|nr:hypothetical protein [Bacteroidales bacterium]
MKTSNLRAALVTAWLGVASLTCLTTGCRTNGTANGTADGTAWSAITLPAMDIAADSLKIYPDYTFCRLPRNIAPCNFRILTPHTRYRLTLRSGGERLYTRSGRGVVPWPLRRWKQWLSACAGDTLWVALSLEQDGQWHEMPPFPLYIDTSAIAPYLTYRLIEPSYQLCNLLTIEERCLENFKTRNLYDNLMNEFNCVNCHTSAWGDPDYSVYHTRFERSGTFVAVDGQLRRVDLTSNRFSQGGVYPAWHPGKRYIAFGTAKAFPFVHSKDIVRRTEVFDSLGDIMIYDILRNRILSAARICTEEKEAPFPAVSPDGR